MSAQILPVADPVSRGAPPDPRHCCTVTLETDVRSLREVPMFRGIDLSKLKLLAFTSERIHFDEGQRFFSQGDPSDAAYVILEGRALVLVDTAEGETAVAELGQGALVGEMGVLGDKERSATILALEPTTVLRTDRGVLLELMAQFPQIAVAIMRELAARLDRLNRETGGARPQHFSGFHRLRSADIEALMRSHPCDARAIEALMSGWADPIL
jgi:signal-transduction protein with cAMP-binding, CBS, and nucleotidyltransferase domain